MLTKLIHMFTPPHKTEMSIYTACLQAADYIEQHPDRYNFWEGDIPQKLTDTGCILGWIAYFYGTRGTHKDNSIDVFCRPSDRRVSSNKGVLPVDQSTFYDIVSNINGEMLCLADSPLNKIADAIRAYAKRYHHADVTS